MDKRLQSLATTLSLLWRDRCTVTVQEAYQKPSGATAFRPRAILSDAPCKLSYFLSKEDNAAAAVVGEAAPVHRRIRLFLAPDVEIPAGSRVDVTRAGKTIAYKASGESAVYFSHQEIILEAAKEWA